MAHKEVFVEVVKPFWHGGKPHGVGSILKMKENDANLCIGLGRGKASEAKAEKLIDFGKKQEVRKAEKV